MIIRRKRHITPGLNTTSTADISFMLLIFFLVTTSMDVDKGLSRLLPAAEPQKKEPQTSVVDKSVLLSLHVTAKGLLANDRPLSVDKLRGEALQQMHRLGARHLIAIESDRDADYNLYFQMQDALMQAYAQWRDEYAAKHYGSRFSILSGEQKEKVRKACPQRITESYAQAASLGKDARVSEDAEEQKGGKP